MNYKFFPYGTVTGNKPSMLFLDNGNALRRGVIDHHHPKAPKHSATMLTFLHPELIPKETKTIALHVWPDLDCIASSFLAEYYLIHGHFPKFAYKLATFLDKVDFGKSAKYKLSLSSLFAMVKSECSNELEIVKQGHRVITECAKYGFESGLLPPRYRHYAEMIDTDYNLYLKDLKKAEITYFNVPKKSGGGKMTTECLIIEKPQSKLFTDWARNDSTHTKNGFDMLVVKLSSRRSIISVKPDGFNYLKGLGDRLNAKEREERSVQKIILNENNRIGYNMPDPWYDGRNPSHNYTIIDAPRRGTELSFEMILKIIKDWSRE